ncbi:MAG: HlyD family efflux transporter periplasmic adaptor subunit [Halieaceae bacterium]|jgi:membrane fusion protein|nr:HlyD family efflux transporter periplasmic adaptor subunit [Halieaceae bacterium]
MGLFRREVLDAQRTRLHGEVLLLPRWPQLVLAAGLVLWVSAALVLLTQGEYARKETVRGWLEPAAGTVRVYPAFPGRITRLLVAPGERVTAGTPLAVISGDHDLQGGQSLQAVLLREMTDKRSTLERELARQAELSDLRRRALEGRIRDLSKTTEALKRQRKVLAERLRIAGDRLARHEKLAAPGHVPLSELERLRDVRLTLQAGIEGMDAALAEKSAERNVLVSQRDRLAAELASSQAQLRLSMSDLLQQIARLQGDRSQVLSAPVAATVSGIDSLPGQQAHPSTPVLTLLPSDSPLVARLLVPVHAAGFLAPGQELAIRYDAFPFQKFGIQQGRLTDITANALVPAEQHALPVRLDKPAYKASALPARRAIDAYGETVALRAGMTLSADIQLEQRSLLEWLLEPLLSLRGHLG